MFYIRNEEGITNALNELARIEKEDLPKMYIPSKSRQFNTDWQKAIEVSSMLTCAKGTGYAALERKETRGGHCRTDYPEMDNENWLVHVVTSFADGQWTTSIEPIDDSIIPIEEVREMLPPPLGIN
jgi:succinate dehydrogenase / fumarate reductase flavoprotein subunit